MLDRLTGVALRIARVLDKTTLVIVFATLANAQQNAQIAGAVTDASGAGVSGAKVSVTNEGTGIRREVVTNESGNYVLPLLQPGSYRVEISANGFRGANRSGVRLEVGQTGAINFALEVGAVSESVEVKDTSPLLDTATNAIGGIIGQTQVENMPMRGRNSNSLMVLVPGVRTTRATTSEPVLESHYQFFSINGSRPNQSQFMLDGGNNTNLTFNGPEYSPQVESVQEYRVQTNSYSAEYANSAGGIINVVTKGGTNEFHGTLFEYFRNDKLSANNFFSNQSGRERPSLRYNQFGGSIGGPIVRNRTFFFFGFEALRMKTPAVVNTSVPTALQRAGDFSQTLDGAGNQVIVYDPLTTRPDSSNAAGFVRTPFPGNRIPQNRINPISGLIQSYFPNATSAGDRFTGLNNFFFSGAQDRVTNDFSGRVDHQFNTNTMLMARFSRFNLSNWTNPAVFGSSNIASPGYVTKPQYHPNAIVKLTRTFSPTLFGEFLASWARWHYESLGLSNGFNPTELGLPSSIAANSGTLGFPIINPGEMSSLGGYYNELDISDRVELKANMSKIIERHTLKFGGLYGLGKYSSNVDDNGTGVYSFNKGFTQGPNPLQTSTTGGFGYATFLLGALSSGSQNPTLVSGKFTQPYYGFYLQDDFKVSPRVSLNLGLRWDYESPRREAQNRVANFDFTTLSTLSNGTVVRGGLLYPGVNGVSADNWNQSRKNFQPRIGLSFTPRDGTVIRTGYGIFYSNTWGNGRNGNALPQTGFNCSTPVTSSLDNGLTPFSYFSNPFSTGFCRASGSSAGLLTNLGQGADMIDRNLKLPYMQTWNFDIQQKLPGDFVVEAAYSGSRGVHLMGALDFNQLAPRYQQLGAQLNSQVTNPFYGVIQSGPLAQPTISLGQSLRPYPQYIGVNNRAATYGNSGYHAFYARAERRLAKGFSVTAAYTWSKLIDNLIPSITGFPGESFSFGDLQNYYNLSNERAIAPWNTPQTFVFSYVYELPFGPGRSFFTKGGTMGKVVGGWEINGITTFQSGTPLQIVGGNSSGSFAGTQRPNWTGSNPTKSGAVTDRLGAYFDTSAFALNAPFSFGNAPRIMPNLYGPGTNNFDFSLFKTTDVRENIRLQFRAEAFNVFNRVQFGNPNTDITSNAFGRINSQQNSPRSLQLVLKVLF